MKEGEALADLKSLIERKVAEGFDSPGQIEADVHDVAADEYPDLKADTQIKLGLAEALKTALEAERTWPAVTDCDRLDRAFALLEARGVVARQNFACCQTCGHAEIGEEIEAARKIAPVIGYVFFHMQDTESAADGGGLYLAYGPVGDTSEVQVGKQIQGALREVGLHPQWNGEATQRIHVPMSWQKRRGVPAAPIGTSQTPRASNPWWQFWKN
ncbi:MAG: hypothetical protein OES32_04100 [Acidobacteriota bacterium]|nr:hypothetical protein [Acidobacteriota bacterium]MDH3522746.1 hypothetical protein [Acidobacteriota bacterium]